ncbi:hypothetical protein RJT34_05865 [Clitoria ternatea]|uniref:Cupin type-1 domain-containing protein n=1 Tax=Clitoria ternatea TaxID=43366 RepID=A0AAN9K3H5_CLITE
MEPRKALLAWPFWWLLIFYLVTISLCGVVKASSEEHHDDHEGPVVEKDQRRTLLVTEYGMISAIDIRNRHPEGPPYHLQFITLEPNSLFLPVLLHAHMVFYVHSGSGRLTWANDDGTSTIDLREGDICSLNEGSVFYMQSNLDAERRKLRIYAMFANTEDDTYDPSIGAYSRINELIKGFDKKIMQAALKVPEDVIEAITSKKNTPGIVHVVSEKHQTVWELEASFLDNFLGVESNKKKKLRTYNIFKNDPDFRNCYGWSVAVTNKKLKSLKRSNLGFMMVNLTRGSILGPHWNPRATEIAVALEGEGIVRVVCGSNKNDEETECQNMRFKVKEGDAFVVPRFHPMAQMSFDNGPFVFLGFTTAAKENRPQFLTGKRSVLHILDKHILATSFGVSNRTIDHLLSSRDDSIMFQCVSCAEEEEKIMQEEREKEKEEEEERDRKEEDERKKEEEEEERQREEEAAKRKEEEAREREEEEGAKRKEEEEEEAKRKEEIKRKMEEEAAKRKMEEEAAKRKQEEERRKREEARGRERERKREEQAEAKRKEEIKRKIEEEAAKRKQEKERRKREEARERERERKREEQAAKRKEAAAAAKREEEAAAKRMREMEEEMKRKIEEEAKRKREEERERERERGREAEEAKRQQEKREREREKEQEQKEKARRERERERKQEEQEAEAAAARRKQEEKESERQQKGREKKREHEDEEEAPTEWEEEAARRQQQERERKRERERDTKFMQGQSNWNSVEGRTRVLKARKI